MIDRDATEHPVGPPHGTPRGAFHLPLWATIAFATLSTAATMWLRVFLDVRSADGQRSCCSPCPSC
ncbi:hypothetical protein BH11GEM2_BH11GEM2_34070 [soil metagenome]